MNQIVEKQIAGVKGEAFLVKDADVLSGVVCRWFLKVPKAAPLWREYLMSVVSADNPRRFPLARYTLGLSALHPGEKPIPEDSKTWRVLRPANIVMGFQALNDDKAQELAAALAQKCVEGVLNPEPTKRADVDVWAREVRQFMGLASRKHGEAFCIMTYRCKECGHEEKVWNSRDGVTPFVIGCVKCGGDAQHVRWQEDVRDPDHIPEEGEYVWVDMPESLKEPLARRKVARLKGTKHEITDPEERRQAIKGIVKDMHEGCPFLVRI